MHTNSCAHGTKVKGCPGCQRAWRSYDRRRRTMLAHGTWQHPVPADQVQTHINTLRQQGMTLASLARAANLSQATVRGATRRTQFIQGAIATAILAVAADTQPRVGLVSSTGTIRRLQALVAYGYPVTTLAEIVDRSLQTVMRWMSPNQRAVTEDTATIVATLYDKLAAAPPPSPSAATNRARLRGKRLGWALPHMWDDDTINDPTATPHTPAPDPDLVDDVKISRVLSGDRDAALALTPAERAAAAHIGLRNGLSTTRLGELLSANTRTITRLAQKAAA
jgi:lambda repressor-like predicted transcriptional regulator